MEDLSIGGIVTLLTGFFAIISVLAKAKAKKGESDGSVFPELENDWQNQASVEQHTSKPHRRKQRVETTATMQNVKNKTTVNDNTDDKPIDTVVEDSDKTSPSIDFDIREAVIYSEILKPKFDE